MTNKEKAELNNKQLEKVTGGSGKENYTYSFRKNDYVYINSESRDRFVVDEDVDTNEGSFVINGHKSEVGVKERDVRYTTMTASAVYTCYTKNGGRLQAI